VEGIRLVENELSAALARVGIEAYSPEGEPFDPELHEAMAKQPVDGAASGTVAEVYQRGYRQNGVVLRPARVVVAE
jgi:molecular chaperone GrpE